MSGEDAFATIAMVSEPRAESLGCNGRTLMELPEIRGVPDAPGVPEQRDDGVDFGDVGRDA